MADDVYWGDMHLNLHSRHIADIEAVFAEAREHLDFLPIAYYPYDYVALPQGLRSESIGPSQRATKEYERVREIVREFNEPGRFITFAGYEWHGDRRWGGDHNVFYPDNGPLALPDTLPELYEHCRATAAIAIPHHTAYRAGPGSRGKVWDMHDAELSPVAEIFSHHGCSEAIDAPLPMSRNQSMGPRVSGGTIQDGLAMGYHIGIIASGDTHTGCPGVWNHGLAAVYAGELTRKALWEGLQQRRTYGVTGDRILVDFRVNDAPMGAELRSSGDVEITASAVGEAAIDRIELLRDNRVIATHCHAGTWDTEPGGGEIHAKLRLAVGWGPSDEYGFERTGRRWSGRVRIDGGEIVGARGCFTRLGQRHTRTADNECEWQLTTSGRGAGAENIQAIVFDLAGTRDSQITVDTDGGGAGRTGMGRTGACLLSHQLSIAEALRTSRVIPLLDEARQAIWDRFGLKPEDIPSPDGVYHNAPKIKLHRATPEAGYSAALSFTDRPPAGVHWYYLRVSQTNGQMAWTSPVWVEV